MSVSKTACLVFFVVACGGDKTAPTHSGSGGGGGSVTDAGHHGQGDGTGGATNVLDATAPLVEAGDIPCQADSGTHVTGAVCILHVDGRAIDQGGAPVPDRTPISVCGPTNCNGGQTNATGYFRAEIGQQPIVPDIYAVQVHLRPQYAAFYFQLPKDALGPFIEMGNARVLSMPASGPTIDIDRAGAAAQSLTSGDVTLEVAANTYVRLDVESNLAAALGKEFRALRVPDGFLHEYADASTGIRVLYAMEPFETQFEVGGQPNVLTNARLSFTNYAKLAAGSSVDLLALGSYVFPDWIPPATFQKVATGHVSADGNTIALDPGQGLPYLTWVGLRSTP